jgi:plastocyanin
VTANRTVTAAFSVAPGATVTVGPNGSRTFAANTVTITAGQSVRWEWGSSNHNVVSGTGLVADNQFCSPGDTNCTANPLSLVGTVYTHTFNTPGTYSYFCRQHVGSGMTGTVQVNPPE